MVALPESTQIDTHLWLTALGIALAIVGALAGAIALVVLLKQLVRFAAAAIPADFKDVYNHVIAPYKQWLLAIAGLTSVDLVFLNYPIGLWVNLVEFPLSLGIAFLTAWLSSQVFKAYFDSFLLDQAIQNHRKVNSEVLILSRVSASAITILLLIVIFAQTHQVNIVGLFASLGVGGLAVAFAAQKSLEQLLGGIVLYIDRPFVVDDYIGLPDGTFGRVESIGLRSTKIRTSGKGTVVVVPNSLLTSVNIENFTGAKKVISMIYLTFHRSIEDEEMALIRQVIFSSTADIFGIDSNSTEIAFKELTAGHSGDRMTQAQVSFFILGAGEVSQELRLQLLDVARQSVDNQLQNYGIEFDIEDRTINVDSPITI
ncbi:small-conductance mechanosensitive channel [Rubidibacter lacunae KORDI 51-2]|uniref:Small-conductance mechanosensitive channel n=1 Tax=Rubidibacter lacunae KORDI 51-2 TaxID=582515 RepID=U5DMI4_9CHRO|nr:mechanosensitive ion channel domain-containing protein [Rubidibacter lacunae]ERN40915.1 small-conductance mechanosensitive channel [Rubidibacter lacunae KORDI 51-2]